MNVYFQLFLLLTGLALGAALSGAVAGLAEEYLHVVPILPATLFDEGRLATLEAFHLSFGHFRCAGWCARESHV